MNASEVAAELGVVERTVRRWIASGQLPAEKHGGIFEIDLDAARAVHSHSRSARASERSVELAELRGRYLEARERLVRVEKELAEERRRSARLENILWPPKPAHEGAETAPLPRFPLFDSGDPALGEELDRELGSKSKGADKPEGSGGVNKTTNPTRYSIKWRHWNPYPKGGGARRTQAD